MKNVFHLSFRPRYYLLHPLKFLKEVCGCVRDAWHRATHGWAYSDVWNFNTWFLEIIPDMLDYLAANGYGYPGDNEFPTYESWQQWLLAQAAAIRSCSEEAQEKRNEFKYGFDAAIEQMKIVSKPDPDNSHLITLSFENEPENMDELRDQYYTRAQQIAEEADATLENALIELAHKMPTLWD